METEVENGRPNIRIQIENNVTENTDEKMDVDIELLENEEGEISDDNTDDQMNGKEKSVTDHKIPLGRNAIFTTGINIFDKKEQEKLQERAKRFALKPDEIVSFTDDDLQDLHESLGVTPANRNEFKFETVHLLGLDEMSAEDVVEYFAGYAPEGIEWIDDNSCNVVWLDVFSAARALHFKSRVVRGMPARAPKDLFPKEFLDDVEEPEPANGESILVKNMNREVELQNEIGEIIMPKKKTYPKNSVDISEITISIPPGYWRLGNPHPKTKCLLVRFGHITDKLPFKSEKCSKYYKKISNPNQRNVISESKKKELRSIFERNKELNRMKNPWGSLAKNWDKDARYREREPIMPYKEEDDDVQIVSVKNPKLQARLGTKRKRESSEDEAILDDDDEEEEKTKSNSKLVSERKNVKLPRMKMYADEEEENQKRKKILLKIKKQTEVIEQREKFPDLRSMLGHTNRHLLKKDVLPPPSEALTDLGSRLKNRNQRMVFALERDPYEQEYYDNYVANEIYAETQREMVERSARYSERERSPMESRSVLIRSRIKEERDGIVSERQSHRHLHRDKVHSSHRSSRRRTPERTLHSDRMHSRSSRHRRRSYSPDKRHRRTESDRTKSKVAVVMKTPKKPAVASTIWSKVRKSSDSEQSSSESESESESERSTSEESSSSESSSSESRSGSDDSEESDASSGSSGRRATGRNPDRPGFDKRRLSQNVKHSPLKITTKNEHFSHKRKKV